MKKITESEIEMLWGEVGPYSEAKISINTRILDDRVSRIMLEVEGFINPTTFRVIKKNQDKFLDDPMLCQLLETAVYRGKGFGYHISAGTEEFHDNRAMGRARIRLDYMRETIIKMHKFVMKYYGIEERPAPQGKESNQDLKQFSLKNWKVR